MRFAPTLKRSRSPLMTKPRKFLTASDAGFRTEEIIATTSPPIAFFRECSSMQPMPSPMSTSEAPGLDLNYSVAPPEICDARVPGVLRDGHPCAGRRVVALRAVG